ncbi:hypothetical protein [Bartonella grahamii]|nr:hypothetical protein [Bartonella grahamii]
MINENTFELSNGERDNLWEALDHIIYDPYSGIEYSVELKNSIFAATP